MSAVTYGMFDRRDALGTKLSVDSANDAGGTVSWAMSNERLLPWPGWTGAGIEYLRDAAGKSLTAVSVGTIVPVTKRFSLGATGQHLGPAVQSFPLPGIVKLGGTYQVHEGWRVGSDAGYELASRQASAAAGAEVAEVGEGPDNEAALGGDVTSDPVGAAPLKSPREAVGIRDIAAVAVDEN